MHFRLDYVSIAESVDLAYLTKDKALGKLKGRVTSHAKRSTEHFSRNRKLQLDLHIPLISIEAIPSEVIKR